MKKSVLILINIILVVLMLGVFAMQSSAKADGNYLNSSFLDNTGLVENSDALTTLVQQTAQKLEMNIFIYSAGTSDSYRTDYDIERFADGLYDEIYGEDTDGVFYYMDVSGRSPACDHISTSGKAVLMYQKNIENIFTRLDNYLPASTETVTAEHIENTVKGFLSALEDYSTNKLPAYNAKLILISLAVGVVVAVITYFVIANRYKFKKSQNPVIYARNKNTVFRRQSDSFIRTYTTKQKIHTSSGGGGSPGGGDGIYNDYERFSNSGRFGGGYGGGHGGGSHHR